jgi:hypothetical protein
VSGGFGDSNSMDPETMRILKENQERADKMLAKIKPIDPNLWDEKVIEDHTMESQVFDFDQVKITANFGIK